MSRVNRIEYERDWGWIARKKDGSEIVPGFCWRTREVARCVVQEHDILERDRTAILDVDE